MAEGEGHIPVVDDSVRAAAKRAREGDDGAAASAKRARLVAENIINTTLVDSFSAAVKAADWPAACASVQACLEQIPQLSSVLSSAQGTGIAASIKKEKATSIKKDKEKAKQPQQGAASIKKEEPLQAQRAASAGAAKEGPKSPGIYTFLLKDNGQALDDVADVATGLVHRYPGRQGAPVRASGKLLSSTIYKPTEKQQPKQPLFFDDLQAKGTKRLMFEVAPAGNEFEMDSQKLKRLGSSGDLHSLRLAAGKEPKLYNVKTNQAVDIKEVHLNMQVLGLCTVGNSEDTQKPVLLKTFLKVYRDVLPQLS